MVWRSTLDHSALILLIRQAYNLLQRFTADVSDEIRAPLAAVLSNAQVGLISSMLNR